jgi:hypothetical protein
MSEVGDPPEVHECEEARDEVDVVRAAQRERVFGSRRSSAAARRRQPPSVDPPHRDCSLLVVVSTARPRTIRRERHRSRAEQSTPLILRAQRSARRQNGGSRLASGRASFADDQNLVNPVSLDHPRNDRELLVKMNTERHEYTVVPPHRLFAPVRERPNAELEQKG